MNVTLKQLRVFDAVASSGSLAGAAAALNITISTASASLKELQQSMDRPPLFAKNGRTLQLTAEGEQLQPKVRSLLLSAAEIERPSLGEQLRGEISIGSVETSDDFVPRVAAAFRKLHPNVRINITAGGFRAISELLTRYSIDVMVSSAVGRTHGTVRTELYRERSAICASPEHPLASVTELTTTDLENAEWCMPDRASLSSNRCTEALRGHVANFNVAMEINSDAGIREAVRANCGIACLPMSIVRDDLYRGSLVELKVRGGLSSVRPIYLIHMGDVERSALAQTFHEFVISRYAQRRNDDAAGLPTP